MSQPKLSFFVVAVVLAGFFALICVFLYGAVFQHDRYWNGTIARVQKTEAAILKSILQAPGVLMTLPQNPEALRGIFKPLDGKLVVEIKKKGDLYFSNVIERRNLGSKVEAFTVGDVTISIHSYTPPTWGSRFTRWIKQPVRWFEPSFDFITYPFFFFFLIFLTSIYAIGWRIRAKYLSEDVLAKLNEDPIKTP